MSSFLFNFGLSPFDSLTPAQRDALERQAEPQEHAPGSVLLGPEHPPTHLWVLQQGHVSQWRADGCVAHHGPGACIDVRALLTGHSSDRWVADDTVSAHALPLALVSDLLRQNTRFGALLFSDLGHKLGQLAQQMPEHELHALGLATVKQAVLRSVHRVDASTSVYAVVQTMHRQGLRSVLVQDPQAATPRLGVFSSTGLQAAILDGRPLEQLPVGELAQFPTVSIDAHAPMADAVARMLQARVHRLVVTEDSAILGTLEALDLFGFFSHQSQTIRLQIQHATTLDELAQAARHIERMIALLQRGGTRVMAIAEQVQALNAELFAQAWALIAPPGLRANSCLFVMGSEGRGEQLLKTDQDNGLVLRDAWDGLSPEALQTVCERFSEALSGFGYPPCPGRVMVNNPAWRDHASDLAHRAQKWLLWPKADSLMQLAIFMDAHPVAGDASLLAQAQTAVHQLTPDNPAVLARFAAIATAFGQGQTAWWQRWRHPVAAMDLKKEGIFPLVHGVRSLALAHGITASSTLARIQGLVSAGVLEPGLGTELGQSLAFFMELKLRAGLAELEQQRPVSGQMDLQGLSPLEHDLLKDTLAVVRRFKELLRHHFHLEMLS